MVDSNGFLFGNGDLFEGSHEVIGCNFQLEGVTCHGCFSQLVWIDFAASLDCLRIDDVLRPFSNVKRKVVIDFQEESILKSLYQIHDFATGCTFGFATKPSGPGNRSWSRAWSHMLGAYEEQRKGKVKIQKMPHNFSGDARLFWKHE